MNLAVTKLGISVLNLKTFFFSFLLSLKCLAVFKQLFLHKRLWDGRLSHSVPENCFSLDVSSENLKAAKNVVLAEIRLLCGWGWGGGGGNVAILKFKFVFLSPL